MTDRPPAPSKQERQMWPASLIIYVRYLEGIEAGNRAAKLPYDLNPVADLELPPNHAATKTGE